MRDAQKPAAFVDATAVEGVLELALRIRDGLLGQPSPVAAAANLTAEAFRRQEAPVGGASRAVASLLREIGQADATTILVDASGSSAACFDCLGACATSSGSRTTNGSWL